MYGEDTESKRVGSIRNSRDVIYSVGDESAASSDDDYIHITRGEVERLNLGGSALVIGRYE